MKKRQVVIKRDYRYSRITASSSFAVRAVRYGECRRNHAAHVGVYAVDGCGEFMPCGEEGSGGALTCAACGCHRNFHRRLMEVEVAACDCGS